MNSTLYLFPALTAAQGERGSFILTHKFLDGILEFSTHWPGNVMVCMGRSEEESSNLDHITVQRHDLPDGVRMVIDNKDHLSRHIQTPGIVLASLVDKHVGLGAICRKQHIPLVVYTEYSLQTRKDIIRVGTRNPILRWRRQMWESGLEKKICSVIRQAAGVQCNGTPTFDAYHKLNENSLLYFDSRIRSDMIVSQEVLDQRVRSLQSDRPLRLAFSGRLIGMKGADHLPRLAAELKKLNVPFSLDICGGGILEHKIAAEVKRQELTDHVQLRGVLNFESELLPFVSNHIDVFVCCHPQGDPSCTYLETMACGVPIVGYSNEAFVGIQKQSGAGWVVPMNQPEAMARQLLKLNANRDALKDGAYKSQAFALEHTFEQTMKRRCDHLLECCREVELVNNCSDSK